MVVTWLGCIVFNDGGGLCSLWPFVFVGVFVIVGRCGQSLSVVVCVGGAGKEKRSRKQTLFVI